MNEQERLAAWQSGWSRPAPEVRRGPPAQRAPQKVAPALVKHGWWATRLAVCFALAAGLGGAAASMVEAVPSAAPEPPPVVWWNTQGVDREQWFCDQVWRDSNAPKFQEHLERLRATEKYRSCK